MSSGKRIVFIVMAVLLVGVPFVSKHIMFSWEKPVDGVYSAGEYIAGEDLNAGVYDVEALSDGMIVSGEILNEGDKIIGYKLNEDNAMEIQGDGEVKLTPTEPTMLTPDGNGEIVIEHAGDYNVGTQIEPGVYQMSYRAKDESVPLECLPFVQIETNEVDEDGNIIAGEEYHFNEAGDESNEYEQNGYYTIELKAGQTLNINKSRYSTGHIEELLVSEVDIVLKKVE